MPDRRADTRVLIARTPALVVDRETRRSFDVVICDFDRDGCTVVGESVADFPIEVGLQIKGFDEVIEGRVAWRTSDRAGIEFAWTDPAADTPVEPAGTISIPATVRNRSGGMRIRCTIEGATRTSCRIACDHVDTLHDDIVITISARKVAIVGRIVWRAGGCAGVQLKWPAGGQAPRPNLPDAPRKGV